MSRKTEYVHNPCFLSANILKILGVFAENQKLDQLMDKLKNDKLKSTLGHQLNQHKYKSPRLDNF